MLEKLYRKWNITSHWQFIIINLVFALAGMSIIFEREPIFQLLGIGSDTALWIKICVYIPIVFPCYQINLLVFGTLLGQFKFFWEKEKQMARFLFSPVLRLLGKSKYSNSNCSTKSSRRRSGEPRIANASTD